MMNCPFDLTSKKQIIEFEEVDPYNTHNIVRGFINRRQGHLYGSLWMTHVNGKKCEQLIYSAPKQHYPFDKDKNWEWPECDYIELYEKLDGTCIIAYRYDDAEGNEFYTYKTRLRPFLGTGKYGNFFELWNEMLRKYPNINRICEINHSHHFVFELYGKRNKILIDYDIPLTTKLVFAVERGHGIIYSPNIIQAPTHTGHSEYSSWMIPELDLDGIPILEIDTSIDEWDENEICYIDMQNELEAELQIDEENQIMKGKEGLVWYFIKDDMAVQIKCKPPSVLKYHWSGDAIAYESVYTTVINAFENFDEPTYDDVVGLLKEEFDDDKIEKSRVRIDKVLDKVLFDRKFQSTLAEDYRKHGFDINKDKVTCMQFFGKNYPKSQAHKIYNLLLQYEEE